MTSRNNHYVPEWYQTGFAKSGGANWLLDVSPPRRRPDGTLIEFVPRSRSPQACFWERDLYVTRFGEQLNDQIETVLFQGIDDFGANAVRAYIAGDQVQMHHHCQRLFDYMGAQKLRTPKGLDWISSRYPSLNKVELLVEMQQLRQMFCTVWVEGVREIVSADDSEVKFLVSDHPVTTFNAALVSQTYPDDAGILLNGTQTLFALDANHCLILTHVPYAKAPAQTPLVRKRINARHFGGTIMRTDALIRERRLSADEVIAVNHVLKQRARRYIAAGAPGWLYPERQAPFDLKRTSQLLLPPEDQLFHFGGEIYIGYQDGRTGYRDEHGRTSRDHEFVAKQPPTLPFEADDECPCGSGEAFGTCCQSKVPADRPPWDVLSLRERNLALLHAIHGILGLDEEADWVRVRRELTNEQVIRLHRFYQFLWPEDADLTELLPAPGDGKSRAIYMGLLDPRTVAESIISLVPLFDQVLVLNPFLNPRHHAADFSPLQRPSAFKQQTLKNVVFLLTLAPLVESNKVVLLPDPTEFNEAFRQSMHSMAEERTAQWEMRDELRKDNKWLSEDDFLRSLRQLPTDALIAMFKKASPARSDEELAEMVAYFRREAERDPLALLQVRPAGESSSHFTIVRSVNLEMALFLGQVTGAVPVTDERALWEHLHLHTRATSDLVGEGDPSRFMMVPYRGYLHPEDAIQASRLPAAEALRKMIMAVQLPTETQVAVPTRLQAIRYVFSQQPVELSAAAEHPELVARMHLTLSMPTAGFTSSTAQRLNVAFGRDQAPLKTSLAIYRQTQVAQDQTAAEFGKPPRRAPA